MLPRAPRRGGAGTGHRSALIADRRDEFLRDFAFPCMQADALYQGGCFLGSALGRFVVARELVRAARRAGLPQRRPQLGHQGKRSAAARGCPGCPGSRHRSRRSRALVEPAHAGRTGYLRSPPPSPPGGDGDALGHRRPQPVGSQFLPQCSDRSVGGAAAGGVHADPGLPTRLPTSRSNAASASRPACRAAWMGVLSTRCPWSAN